MTDASMPIDVDRFERIEAAPHAALLRLSGRVQVAGSIGAPVLLVDGGGDIHRVIPLPAPPDPPGVLRVAFRVPLELLRPGTTYALELQDGQSTPLPEPRRRPSLARQQRVAERHFDATPGGQDHVADRVRELERQLEDALSAVSREQAEVAQAREQAGLLAASLDEAQAREMTLEEVVRAETARREQLRHELAAEADQRVEAARSAEQRAVSQAERATAKLAQVREALEHAIEEAQEARLELEHERRQRDQRPQDDEPVAPEQQPQGPPRGLASRMQAQRKQAERRAATRQAIRRAREEERVQRRQVRPTQQPPSSFEAEPEATDQPSSIRPMRGTHVELRRSGPRAPRP